jgi:hypothetical protein
VFVLVLFTVTGTVKCQYNEVVHMAYQNMCVNNEILLQWNVTKIVMIVNILQNN